MDLAKFGTASTSIYDTVTTILGLISAKLLGSRNHNGREYGLLFATV